MHPNVKQCVCVCVRMSFKFGGSRMWWEGEDLDPGQLDNPLNAVILLKTITKTHIVCC